MSNASLRQLRVLHVVGADGTGAGMQQSLFMPLLTRMPRHRVKAQVITLAPGAIPAAVVRQHGVPVHEVPLSARRFSARAPAELMSTTRRFRPDVIQAWGHTAQIAALAVRARCEWKPQVVWSAATTAPLPRHAGLIDRQKLKLLAKLAAKPDRIVFASEAAALMHRRAGFPEEGYAVIPPGVDATRFKPDLGARRKLREQLQVPADAFVIGMMAPFQPEYDQATLIKAVGELIKTHPNAFLLLAGHGVSKGNATLAALLGTGALSSRALLLGEWSDAASFFNACDVACSSAQTDNMRMTLAMAMLCGVPCVATGMGAQGEVLGKCGVALEAGSPAAFVRGISRILEMPPEKRMSMAQNARKHALRNFVYILSLQKYLQLYYDLVGRESLACDDVPAPQDEAEAMTSSEAITIPVPTALTGMEELRDPDSLEGPAARAPTRPAATRIAPSIETPPSPSTPGAAREAAPAAQLEPGRAQPGPSAETAASPAEPPPPPVDRSEGDVLEIFEADIARMGPMSNPATAEMARGVAEEVEELLPIEMLQLVESDPPKPAVESGPATPVPPAPDIVQLELLADDEDERKHAAGSSR